MFIINTSICPECNKEFVPAPFNVFKIKSVDYCSYTCYMSAKREQERLREMPKTTPVVVHTRKGEYVGEYANAKEASRELGLASYNVYRCLRGEQSRVGEFVFTYKR